MAGPGTYIKRDYSGYDVKYPTGEYFKLEIESYDPANIYFKYKTGFKGTNIDPDRAVQNGLYAYVANDKTKNFTLNGNYKITTSGSYRIELVCTPTTYSETITVKINGKTIKNKFSAKAKDNSYFRRYDLGIQTISPGNIPIQIISGGHIGIITLYLKKIRATQGDSNEKGILTLSKAKVTPGTNKQVDTLAATIKNIDKLYTQGGFKEPKSGTGLIFQFRDSVNFYVKDWDNKIRRVFGGYLSSAILSDDKMSINLSCAGRLKDAERRKILKQITVGGAENEITNMTYNTNSYYDVLAYLCEYIEMPLKIGNLSEVKNKVPSKTGYHWDYSSKTPREKVAVKNMLINRNSKSITLRNNYKKNQTQSAILWDSNWNKAGEKKGYNITSTPIFFLKYGMGDKTSNKTVEVYIPKKYTKKGKVRKGTGIKKKKKGTVGYNTETPFKAWIELQYSKSPGKSAARKTVTLEFTADPTTGKIGSITPVLKNNTQKKGEVDVVNILKSNDPSTNYYLRRVALKWDSKGDNDIYDPKTEKDTYKMLFYGLGFREGEVTSPEVVQSSGQPISDQMYNCQDKLNLDFNMNYGKNRSDDVLMIRRENTEVSIKEFCEGKDGNILDIQNVSYMPVSNMKNSVVKVFKKTDTTNTFVTNKSPESIFRWGEDMDLEVLDDDCGEYYARYKAKTDEDKNLAMTYSYTLVIKGYPHVTMGEDVICTFNNPILNDLQTTQSIEIDIDIATRPMVRSTYGCGEMNPLLKAKVNYSKVRSNILKQRTLFSGGASESDFIDLFE